MRMCMLKIDTVHAEVVCYPGHREYLKADTNSVSYGEHHRDTTKHMQYHISFILKAKINL